MGYNEEESIYECVGIKNLLACWKFQEEKPEDERRGQTSPQLFLARLSALVAFAVKSPFISLPSPALEKRLSRTITATEIERDNFQLVMTYQQHVRRLIDKWGSSVIRFNDLGTGLQEIGGR